MRYEVTVGCDHVRGIQVFVVDAASEEEARKMVHEGKGEFAHEVFEVQSWEDKSEWEVDQVEDETQEEHPVKRYKVVVPVVRASGHRTYYVEARSVREAREKVRCRDRNLVREEIEADAFASPDDWEVSEVKDQVTE